MALASFYIPPNDTDWQGRKDAQAQSLFFQVIQLLNLEKPIKSHQELAFGLIGFACDEGIRRNFGRQGAVSGPAAIRQILAKLPVPRANLICYDAGDIQCQDGKLEEAQRALGEAVALLLQHGITPIILGGGHELAWGHYQGIAKAFPKKELSIVNFDAHFDMRPTLANDQGSSGTPFLQIAEATKANHLPFHYHCIGIQTAGNTSALFETAKNYGVNFIYADDIQEAGIAKATDLIDRLIEAVPPIYLSLCLDVFAAPYAPGVSAPQVLGLLPWQLLPLVRRLASSGKVISYDIAELSPPHDVDSRTAKLAANFIFNIIHYHAVRGSHHA